ncbi:MAG: hypothetical protein H7257_01105 [Taibaiella sp.]|nr:hypothetical protein [Taibaiella sp.]
MKLARHIVFILLSVSLGALFLYSAYSKTFPIQIFEYTMVEHLHFSWMLAAIGARFLIGLEAGIGILLAVNIYGPKKNVLKLGMALMAVFSVYLIYLWAKFGNNINCGCFGDEVWMSPATSLTKNVIMVIVMALLFRFHNGLRLLLPRFTVSGILLLIVLLPFILFAIPGSKPDWLSKGGYSINLDPLYAKDISKPPMDVRHGKYIVAFFSQRCTHCRAAAYKMHLMKLNNPSLPFFMIIGGESALDDFWKATQAQDIPYVRMDKTHFLQYTGGIFPLIVWVNNSRVVATSEHTNLNQQVIEDWVKQ